MAEHRRRVYCLNILAPILCIAASGTALLGRSAPLQVTGRIVRDTFTLQSQPFPSWKVEITYTNGTSAPVELGDTLLLITPSSATPTAIGVHVTRATSEPAITSRRVGDRYGMAWGIDVPPSGSAWWPFGALSSRISTVNALLFMLGSAGVEALPGGGYGTPLRPGEERTIADTILFPFDHEIKGERDQVVVVPPVAHSSGARLPTGILVFDVKGVVGSNAAFAGRHEAVSVAPGDLLAMSGDAALPLWRRLLALNWLAESHPDGAAELLLRLAGDRGQDPVLRNSAILNAGLWRIRGAVPALLSVIETEPAGAARLAAIAALGDAGDAAAAPRLRPLLKDQDAASARFAIDALGRLKDAESVPTLTAVLGDRRQESLYDAAAAALVAIEGDVAREVVMTSIRDRRLRERSREALLSAVGAARASWAVAAVSAVVGDEQDDESVRVRAVWALRAFANGDGITALQKAAASRKKRVREAATAALDQLKQAK